MPDPTTAAPTLAGPPAAEARGRRLARAALLLAVASLVALACTAAILQLVARADFLTGAAAFVVRLAFWNGALAALLAASPLLAALLVGYGYMQRAVRRRAARAARAAAAP